MVEFGRGKSLTSEKQEWDSQFCYRGSVQCPGPSRCCRLTQKYPVFSERVMDGGCLDEEYLEPRTCYTEQYRKH